MKKMARLWFVVAVVLVALALAASPGLVSRLQAQEGGVPPNDRLSVGEPAPDYPQEQADAVGAYLQVPGSALRPENSADVEWAVPKLVDVGCIYAESGDPYGYWNAPIYPPQGATLTKLKVYVFDAVEAVNAEVVLGVVNEYGNVVMGWTAYSSGSAGNSTFEITIPNHQVDYANYSYLLWWKPNALGTNMKICGFRLTYTPPVRPVYMPSVTKGE